MICDICNSNLIKIFSNNNYCYINSKPFPKMLPNIKDNIIELKEFIARIERLIPLL